MSTRARTGPVTARRTGPRLLGVGFAILLAATAMVGCSDGDAAASSDPADLVGKTYLSTEVTGAQIPGGGPLVLSFTRDSLSANAGCNGHGGSVSFDGDTMTAGQLAGTMMACAPPRDTTDRWVADLLGKPLTWKLDKTRLTLSRGEQTVVLEQRTNWPVVGTRWEVTSLVKHEAVSSSQVLQEVKPYFHIDADGKLTGSDGCNRMMGSATVDGNTIDFSPIATTRMACGPEVGEIEKTVLAALRGKTTIKVDGEILSLTNAADGNLGLRLTAVGDA